MIEVEARSFISEEQYNQLIEYMKKNAEFQGEDSQTTHYFSGEADLRIQKGDNSAKVWLKKGKIHDKYREELEIHFDRKDFDKMNDLLKEAGHGVEIKWFRDRKKFLWKGIKVTLDHTKGYGYIIELEKLTEDNSEKIHKELEDRMKELGVEITPKEEFEEKLSFYRKNWKNMIN
jgi:predicted adenylyl cyclase CyaB